MTDQTQNSGTSTETGAAPVSATGAPSLVNSQPVNTEAPKGPEMPQGFEGGADAWGKLDDAGKTAAITAATEKAQAESTARVETFTKAEGKDAKMAAWTAMTKEERVAAFEKMPDELKKELGITDPARPVYTDFKLPEGFVVDEAGMKAATDLFADLGLDQAGAQKLIDMQTAREKAATEAGAKAFVDLQNKWVSEIKADPEVGGDKLTAAIADSARALDRLGGPDLRAAMDLTGAGNNPHIFKAFVRMGQLLKEDRFAPGTGAAPAAPKSPAQTIYGDDPAKPTAP